MSHLRKESTTATTILRAATAADVPRIMEIERIPEYRTMVGVWTKEEHLRALSDPDVRYFLIAENENPSAGFAILRSILSPHKNLELKRLVIAEPGRGLGTRALAAVMAQTFHQLHAHRLWLDVFETNARALQLYRKAGFCQEGILREAIYRDGQFHTLLLLSILDREFTSSHVPHSSLP